MRARATDIESEKKMVAGHMAFLEPHWFKKGANFFHPIIMQSFDQNQTLSEINIHYCNIRFSHDFVH